MDPYRILGVPRGCTCQEVKEAFLVRVQHAHPDRGGDALSFIQLRAAYERILAELDRRPSPVVAACARAPRSHRPPRPPDSERTRVTYVGWLRRVADRSLHRNPMQRWKWLDAIGSGCFLYCIISGTFTFPLAYWLRCALTYDQEKMAPRAGRHYESAESLYYIIVALLSLLLTCWLVWKYDRR
jgi:hypothetical protein